MAMPSIDRFAEKPLYSGLLPTNGQPDSQYEGNGRHDQPGCAVQAVVPGTEAPYPIAGQQIHRRPECGREQVYGIESGARHAQKAGDGRYHRSYGADKAPKGNAQGAMAYKKNLAPVQKVAVTIQRPACQKRLAVLAEHKTQSIAQCGTRPAGQQQYPEFQGALAGQAPPPGRGARHPAAATRPGTGTPWLQSGKRPEPVRPGVCYSEAVRSAQDMAAPAPEQGTGCVLLGAAVWSLATRALPRGALTAYGILPFRQTGTAGFSADPGPASCGSLWGALCHKGPGIRCPVPARIAGPRWPEWVAQHQTLVVSGLSGWRRPRCCCRRSVMPGKTLSTACAGRQSG